MDCERNWHPLRAHFNRAQGLRPWCSPPWCRNAWPNSRPKNEVPTASTSSSQWRCVIFSVHNPSCTGWWKQQRLNKLISACGLRSLPSKLLPANGGTAVRPDIAGRLPATSAHSSPGPDHVLVCPAWSNHLQSRVRWPGRRIRCPGRPAEEML